MGPALRTEPIGARVSRTKPRSAAHQRGSSETRHDVLFTRAPSGLRREAGNRCGRRCLSPLKVEATAQVIANFALQHLKAAITFESEVARLEAKHACAEFGPFFEDIRSYGSARLMSLPPHH